MKIHITVQPMSVIEQSDFARLIAELKPPEGSTMKGSDEDFPMMMILGGIELEDASQMQNAVNHYTAEIVRASRSLGLVQMFAAQVIANHSFTFG